MIEVLVMDELQEMAWRIDPAFGLSRRGSEWALWLPSLGRELFGSWIELYSWCELYLEEHEGGTGGR